MKYGNFKELNLEQFKQGDKITLVIESEFGYPIAMNIKLDKMFLKDWAQYNDCLQVQGVLKGKRKLLAWLIRPYQNFAIFEGFLSNEDFVDFRKVVSDDSNVTVTSYGSCFADNAIKNYIGDKTPLISFL